LWWPPAVFKGYFHQFFTGKMLQSDKLPVLFLLTSQNEVFRPAGATRCTDSGQTLQYRRAPGSAWLVKISRQSVQMGGNAAPKISKISTFW